MAGLTDGLGLLYTPPSLPTNMLADYSYTMNGMTTNVTNGGQNSVTSSAATKSATSGWDIAGSIVGALGTLGNTAATLISASKGNAVNIPAYSVGPNLSAVGSYQVPGNALGSMVPAITGVLDYADAYLANSQTLNRATQNIGSGAAGGLSGVLSQYKTIFIVIGLVLGGLLIFQLFKKR